jgi:hypothetical protein
MIFSNVGHERVKRKWEKHTALAWMQIAAQLNAG